MGHPLKYLIGSGDSITNHRQCPPDLEQFDPLCSQSALLPGRQAGINDGGTVTSVSSSGRAAVVGDGGTDAFIQPERKEATAIVVFSDLRIKCLQDAYPELQLTIPILDRPDGSLKAGRPAGFYEAVRNPSDPRHNHLQGVVFPGGAARPTPLYNVPVNPVNSVPRPNINTTPHHALDVDDTGRPVCARCKKPYDDALGHFAKDCLVRRGPCHYCGSINHKRKKCPQLKSSLAAKGFDASRTQVQVVFPSH